MRPGFDSTASPSGVHPSDRPPLRFLEVASEIAQLLGLDAQMLIAGRPVEAHGVRFGFIHFGQQDADGMTLFAQVGMVPREDEAVALRRLLQLNAATPAARTGYYAIVPGTDDVVCCWRFDISGMDDAARQIVNMVLQMCESVAGMQASLDEFRRELGD
jgi:hypothetical protein